LSKLGLWGETLADLHNAIVQPNGLVLVCGPTWSGKSSTLFSILSSLNTPNINIATLEDPIEYRIAGANQTQVNPGNGITFSSGMEALLLQDPNVIMISAITSGETARLAIEAASSGRLVLSSLHTKTAASALAGLGILGIEPYLIASTVRMTIAQRLVRRLCKSCRESYKPDSILLGHLAKNFDITTYGGFKRIHSLETAAHSEGLGDLTEGTKPAHELGSSATTITRLWKPHNGGCDSCNHSGYQGHIGLYESIVTTSAIQKLIVKNSPAVRIEEAAGEESMVPLRIDGLIKALRGLTTIDEVLRVTA
jgi:type IV pilus assembly protein PilB